MERDEMKCVEQIPYPDQSESFAFGFCAGSIWRLMYIGAQQLGDEHNPMHLPTNLMEFFGKLAQLHGYTVYETPTEVEGIVRVVMVKGAPKKARALLSVIQGGKDGV